VKYRVASKELPPQVPFGFAPPPGGPYAVEKLEIYQQLRAQQ